MAPQLPVELEIPAKFPKPGLYRHTDGGIYRLFGPGYHTEDASVYCAYMHIWPFDQLLWLRPLPEWSARFTPISDEEAARLMAIPRAQAKQDVMAAKTLRKQQPR